MPSSTEVSGCRGSGRSQAGGMLVTMAVTLILMIAVVATAVDIGHLVTVRNELQNAADAAALAGAGCLDRTTATSGTDCTSTLSSSINWSAAAARAVAAVALNHSDGVALTDATVTTGYKNLGGSPLSLEPVTLSPLTLLDKPAVQVTVSRASGLNGGAVPTMVTRMFGGAAVPLSATAVAVLSSPGAVVSKTLIPMVINKCLYDQYWNATTGQPTNATTATLNGVAQVIGQPWELRIGSSYHYGVCDSGQWTSFGQNVNSASAIRALIQGNNPIPMAIGDLTWIEPGTKNTSYNDLSSQYPTPPGADVLLAVVDQPAGLNSQMQVPVVAFAAFHVDGIQGGSGMYIQGHFITAASAAGSSGIGPFYGTYTPPRLAR